jgi:hypothetical protein
MNLPYHSKHYPVESFFPESAIANCPALLSMLREEVPDSEKKYFKILEFLIAR